MNVKITYLAHSGFAVETASFLLVFDYWNAPQTDMKELLSLAGERHIFVFSSHSHHDHFSKEILSWNKDFPAISYLFSSDISCEEGVHLEPDQRISLFGGEISTLASTDLGVAFLFQGDGLSIYHAGDLNWWHWKDEPGDWNPKMRENYQARIQQLKGTSVDIAFLPVDPRLEEFSLLGLDYFMRTIEPALAIPMHFWEDYSIFQAIENSPQTRSYRDRIVRLEHCGQSFFIPESLTNSRLDLR